MSQKSFLEFALSLRGNAAGLARYNRKDAAQLVFHAKHDGYDFTADEAGRFVVKAEYVLITEKDGQEMGADARLWREMWGVTHLEYFVTRVLPRFSEEELRGLVEDGVVAR